MKRVYIESTQSKDRDFGSRNLLISLWLRWRKFQRSTRPLKRIRLPGSLIEVYLIWSVSRQFQDIIYYILFFNLHVVALKFNTFAQLLSNETQTSIFSFKYMAQSRSWRFPSRVQSCKKSRVSPPRNDSPEFHEQLRKPRWWKCRESDLLGLQLAW